MKDCSSLNSDSELASLLLAAAGKIDSDKMEIASHELYFANIRLIMIFVYGALI